MEELKQSIANQILFLEHLKIHNPQLENGEYIIPLQKIDEFIATNKATLDRLERR